MTGGSGLIRYSGITRTAENGRLVSPAISPTDFGMPDVDWAWRSFKPGEYEQRSERIHTLLKDMSKVEPIGLHKFTGRTWMNIMSSLLQSFNVTTQDVESWADLTTLTDTNFTQMISSGVFGAGVSKPSEIYYSQSFSLSSLNSMIECQPEDILFKVLEYRSLPENVQDFLGGINLLIIPQKENKYKAAVGLVPRDGVADERYIRFHERLVKYGIPGILDIRGQHSILDGYLGRFDSSRSAKTLFPQWSQGTNLLEDTQQKSKENYTSLRPAHGQNAAFTQQLESEMERILADDEVIDQDATNIYHTLMGRLKGGGSIYGPQFKDELQAVIKYLDEDQRDLIAIGVINYTSDSMQRGQFRDIEGFDEVCTLLGRSGMAPEAAQRIRMYVDLLPEGTITKVLTSIDINGNVTPDVYNLRVPSDNDNVESVPASIRDMALPQPKVGWSEMKNQGPLRTRLREYVQQYLPVNVSDDILRELCQYGEMIQFMQGRSAFLEDMSTPLAISLTVYSEQSIGQKLPELRRALPYEAGERLRLGGDSHIPKGLLN
ncbi:MAG: hypothetical protein HGA85_07190 [Nanoarchaeota archaeon]|nr:hypothetical protein [Nanoarchaeota archaeon]